MNKKILVSACLALSAVLTSFDSAQPGKIESKPANEVALYGKEVELKESKQLKRQTHLTSRGIDVSRNKPRIMEVTAYTAGFESTGKRKGDPGYNQPAISGTKYVNFNTVYCERGVTVAAGKNIPLGTKVYIPSLKWMNGTGVFVVQDRGGAIGPSDIDVYFGEGEEALEEALQFGRRHLEVYILEEEK